MTLIVLIAVFVVLYMAAFVTRRRFSVLGLALAAGVVLAQNATTIVAQFLGQQGLTFPQTNATASASILLTIMPALVLLAGGPSYGSKRAAMIGAAGFAAFALTLLLVPLAQVLLTIDTSLRSFVSTILGYQSSIIICGIVAALIDTFLVHGLRQGHGAKKHSGH